MYRQRPVDELDFSLKYSSAISDAAATKVSIKNMMKTVFKVILDLRISFINMHYGAPFHF